MADINKQKPARFALRAVGAFLLLAALLGVLFWMGYHLYPDVAAWADPGSRDSFVYDGDTYYLSGAIGKKGLSAKKYAPDKMIGELTDDGVPVITEAPETETDEDGAVVTEPPVYDPTLKGDRAFILYSVKDMEGFLILYVNDEESYLYYREGIRDPLAPDTEG